MPRSRSVFPIRLKQALHTDESSSPFSLLFGRGEKEREAFEWSFCSEICTFILSSGLMLIGSLLHGASVFIGIVFPVVKYASVASSVLSMQYARSHVSWKCLLKKKLADPCCGMGCIEMYAKPRDYYLFREFYAELSCNLYRFKWVLQLAKVSYNIYQLSSTFVRLRAV